MSSRFFGLRRLQTWTSMGWLWLAWVFAALAGGCSSASGTHEGGVADASGSVRDVAAREGSSDATDGPGAAADRAAEGAGASEFGSAADGSAREGLSDATDGPGAAVDGAGASESGGVADGTAREGLSDATDGSRAAVDGATERAGSPGALVWRQVAGVDQRRTRGG
ncbi:MAG TPA: hypothetical protein VJ860_23235 [Polyangia bacterium]|nr:hypothetical protein [Polyangia bacterium]